jgi:hypothetical protein
MQKNIRTGLKNFIILDERHIQRYENNVGSRFNYYPPNYTDYFEIVTHSFDSALENFLNQDHFIDYQVTSHKILECDQYAKYTLVYSYLIKYNSRSLPDQYYQFRSEDIMIIDKSFFKFE